MEQSTDKDTFQTGMRKVHVDLSVGTVQIDLASLLL
jgi:hypothetical protein